MQDVCSVRSVNVWSIASPRWSCAGCTLLLVKHQFRLGRDRVSNLTPLQSPIAILFKQQWSNILIGPAFDIELNSINLKWNNFFAEQKCRDQIKSCLFFLLIFESISIQSIATREVVARQVFGAIANLRATTLPYSYCIGDLFYNLCVLHDQRSMCVKNVMWMWSVHVCRWQVNRYYSAWCMNDRSFLYVDLKQKILNQLKSP